MCPLISVPRFRPRFRPDFRMLKPKTKKIICALAKKYHLKVVILFGSSARKKLRPGSDIDLAVLADSQFYESDFSGFNYDLMKAEDIEKREIEVVPISSYNPILLFNIFNDGLPIYIRNKEDYYRLRAWARFTYENSRRFFLGREKLLEKRMERLKQNG